MINALIKGIFWIITELFNFIFTPVFSVIFALFPSLEEYFNHITSFFEVALTYVRSVLSLFLINDNMIITIFNYFVILFTIHITMLSVRFAIKIYQKFKL